jgi:hypothetical protein
MSGYAQWNPSTTYILDNLVAFDGVIYICIQAPNFNHQPNSSPTWWATNGGGGTITSIVGGAGIGVSGSTAITITNTGVRTLTSGGTGITIGGTSTDRTVSNTGVLALTAGTNITLGGTAQNPVINSTGAGVQTITAGSNVSITGTSANPIISATSSPLPTPQTPRDLTGSTSIVIPAVQLANSVYYSSVPYSSGSINFYLPNYSDMLATYGAQKTVPFFWGDINIGVGQVVDIFFYAQAGTDPTTIWISNSLQGNSQNTNLQNHPSAHPTPYALPILSYFKGTAYINSVKGTVDYNFEWAGAIG